MHARTDTPAAALLCVFLWVHSASVLPNVTLLGTIARTELITENLYEFIEFTILIIESNKYIRM